MAQVRHALRAYVMREADLADALGRLNELTRALLPGEMATAVVSVLDPGAGRLDVVNAGHLPPVLVGRDGAVLLDLPRQPALGLARSMTWTATPVALDRGATLVLCTDGLVERRTTSLDVQLDALVDAAGDLAGQPSQVVCRLLRDRFAPDGSDDVTVLALRLA
jgi:serine phosphatase RsbU (regulator of sigma subunit)